MKSEGGPAAALAVSTTGAAAGASQLFQFLPLPPASSPRKTHPIMKRIFILITRVFCSSPACAREPAVSGQFYPADKTGLAGFVDAALGAGTSRERGQDRAFSGDAFRENEGGRP